MKVRQVRKVWAQKTSAVAEERRGSLGRRGERRCVLQQVWSEVFPSALSAKKDGKLPVGEVKKVSRKEQQADLQERASQESNLESSDP